MLLTEEQGSRRAKKGNICSKQNPLNLIKFLAQSMDEQGPVYQGLHSWNAEERPTSAQAVDQDLKISPDSG